MSDISSINTSSGLRVRRVSVDPAYANSAGVEDVRGRGGARTSDRVELSRVAQYLSQLQTKPEPRSDLIDRVRSEIEAGTYLTDDKLSAATDHLLDDINFEL
jgi:anti-sigma28 factor (negative regulator of flagellin synthesis)